MRFFILAFLILSLSVPNAYGQADDARTAYREGVREWVIKHSVQSVRPAVAPGYDDRAADLVDHLKYTNLGEMEQAGMLAAALATTPWSDSYWPTYGGQIANRYGDKDYYASFLWSENRDYLLAHLGKGTSEELSPAEKYDLLVGDPMFTLTNNMIQAGAPFADEDGSVEMWFGLCHGWAAAAFMMPRPARGVKVPAADGRELTFTPSDMKALGTLLWSNGAGQTRFIGGRCNDRNPNRDDQGRVTQPRCFDTNPATWHLSVVNQIGVAKRSFIMDASLDSEVWNQPVYSYSYSYLNPNTGERGSLLEDAKVRLRDLERDPYAAHRSPAAEYLVNIRMELKYIGEDSPSLEMENSSKDDITITVTYTYDLELDRNGEIVGGEWHGQRHPDFLWVPVQNAQASSRGDRWLDQGRDRSSWNGRSALPAAWKRAAKMSASNSQPLARIVNRLFELAAD